MIKYILVIFVKKILLLSLSGALTGAAFLFPPLKWLLFVAPSVFFVILTLSEKTFLHSFVFGSCFSLVGSSFLATLDIKWLFPSQALSYLLPIVALVAVSAFCGAVFALFARIFSFLHRHVQSKYHPLIFSALWVLTEYILSADFLSTGYPFLRLALPFADLCPFIQTTSLFGMLFISFTVIFFSSSLGYSFYLKKWSFITAPSVLIIVAVIVSQCLYAIPERGESITVAAVQNGDNAYDKRVKSVFDSIEDAKNYIGPEQLTVFPEAAVMADLSKSEYLSILTSESKEKGTALLMGALYRSNDGKKYTSVYLLPNGNISSKRHLVPFGEYIPLAAHFSEEVKQDNFCSSDELFPLTNGAISAGAVICFDSAFPRYSYEAVQNGSNILCVSTNDSWFSSPTSARLHLYHSVFRSVEFSRYTVRSACTGISAVINSHGKIIKDMPQGEKGKLSSSAVLKTNRTLYSFTGDIPMIIFALAAIIFSLKGELKNVLHRSSLKKIPRA